MKPMKQFIRVLVIGAAVVLVTTSLKAQVGFGLKGGVNLTNLRVDDPESSYDSRTGFHGGFFVRDRIGNVAIQPEFLLFTQNDEVSTTILNGTIEESFTYFSIPVMFKFYPALDLNIQAGPQFGFLVDGERRFKTELFNDTRDIRDDYKDSDVSISLGGGWDAPFGLTLDVRYNIGVKDINNMVDGEETRSKVFLLSVGWNFGE